MEVKVCGLAQADNLSAVLDLSVDYVGLIFYPKSKRYAASDTLRKWIAGHADRFGATKKVGVFVNAEVDAILNAVHDYQLDYVQLHGDESPSYCRELRMIWSVDRLRKAQIIKAFSVNPSFNFATTAEYADTCALFIFDTGGHAERGGTGKRWDWERLSEYRGTTPFLLSGGISPDDAPAVQQIQHPAFRGVDLNSKFESAPGVKDVTKLQSFLDRV